MPEWSSGNIFNSFNSFKGLLYQDWYKAIANGKFLPPEEASIDMMPMCNLSCDACNAGRYIYNNTDKGVMSKDHVEKLIRFLGKFGVKSGCFGGGGESTLNKVTPYAIRLCREVGMDAAIITNGTILNDDLLDAFMQCRFVSVSVDAGKASTYEKHKGQNLFDRVMSNLYRIVEEIKKTKVNCDLCYKFLITEWNQHEIFKACLEAKRIGVKDFYVRPANYDHQGIREEVKRKYNYDIKSIEEQFELCKKLETPEFRVFTVTHKYNGDYTPKKDFSQCYGAPVCIQICADGFAYFCVDTRHIEFYKLGSHYPKPENILNFWGAEKHKELVFRTGKDNCTSRCTYGPYCTQCEELFIKKNDPMCWTFT